MLYCYLHDFSRLGRHSRCSSPAAWCPGFLIIPPGQDVSSNMPSECQFGRKAPSIFSCRSLFLLDSQVHRGEPGTISNALLKISIPSDRESFASGSSLSCLVLSYLRSIIFQKTLWFPSHPQIGFHQAVLLVHQTYSAVASPTGHMAWIPF